MRQRWEGFLAARGPYGLNDKQGEALRQLNARTALPVYRVFEVEKYNGSYKISLKQKIA